AQVAEAEEDGPRASPAAQAIFLAEMRKGAGDPGETTGMADPGLAGHAVDVAVPRASAAVLQLPQAGRDPVQDFARAVKLQVTGLERPDHEPGIGSVR